jgi:hypothetical protein
MEDDNIIENPLDKETLELLIRRNQEQLKYIKSFDKAGLRKNSLNREILAYHLPAVERSIVKSIRMAKKLLKWYEEYGEPGNKAAEGDSGNK